MSGFGTGSFGSAAFAGDDVDTALAGSAAAASSASAELSTSIKPAGDAAATSTASGDLTVDNRWAGDALVEADAAGELSTGIKLVADSAAQSTASGAIDTGIPLQGAGESDTQASADLSVLKPIAGTASAAATATGDLSTDIKLAGTPAAVSTAAGDLSTGIKLAGTASAESSAEAELNTPPPYDSVVNIWKLQALIDGVDVSDYITDSIDVSREPNAPATATVHLLPLPGSVSIFGYINKRVIIRYLNIDEDGNEQRYLLFNGVVRKPRYNVTERMLVLDCWNDFKQGLKKKSTAQIDAIIPGHDSSALYSNDAEDSYEYALRRLKSAPGDLVQTIGGALAYAPWSGFANHYDLSAAEILFGSVSTDIADTNTLTNKITVTLEHRFDLGWHREYQWGWDIGMLDEVWLGQLTTTPTKQWVLDALKLPHTAPTWRNLPPTGDYIVPGVGDYHYTNNDPDNVALLGFSCSEMQRWKQTAVETYTVEVSAPAWGDDDVAKESRYSIDTDDAASSWGDETEYAAAPIDTTLVYTDSYRDDYIAPIYAEKSTPVKVVEALQCAVAEAKTEILSGARQSTLQFETIFLEPRADVGHRVSLSVDGCEFTAAISRVQHYCDISSGAAGTRITAQMYLAPEGSTESGEIPESSFVLPTPQAIDIPLLETHIGYSGTSEVYDEAWAGAVINRADTAFVSNAVFPQSFHIVRPAVPDADRDQLNITTTGIISVAIPSDTMSITA